MAVQVELQAVTLQRPCRGQVCYAAVFSDGMSCSLASDRAPVGIPRQMHARERQTFLRLKPQMTSPRSELSHCVTHLLTGGPSPCSARRKGLAMASKRSNCCMGVCLACIHRLSPSRTLAIEDQPLAVGPTPRQGVHKSEASLPPSDHHKNRPRVGRSSHVPGRHSIGTNASHWTSSA